MELDAAVACWDDEEGSPSGRPARMPILPRKTVGRGYSVSRRERPLDNADRRGRFRGQTDLGVEPVCAMLAKVTGKPVKVVITREEDFSGWNSRTEQRQTIRMGVSKDGTVTAIEQDILSDCGAYLSHSGSVSAVNMQTTLGLLRSPVIAGRVTLVYTNNPTASAMRAMGTRRARMCCSRPLTWLPKDWDGPRGVPA